MSNPMASPDPEIPRILRSVQDGKPFAACVQCQRPLLSGQEPYGIEKVVRNDEVILEYAICGRCAFGLIREMSQESLRKMADYLEKNRTQLNEPDPEDLDLFLRALEGETEGSPGIRTEPSLEEQEFLCQVCGANGRKLGGDHSIVAFLTGSRLVSKIHAVCSRCNEGLSDELSRKTRESHDDFVGRNFPGVPSTLDLPVGIMGL